MLQRKRKVTRQVGTYRRDRDDEREKYGKRKRKKIEQYEDEREGNRHKD